MKPYKHIEESKKVLKTLVSEFKNMDNAKTRLTELNVIIKTLNSFEEMLEDKYYTEYFDILILNRFYMTLLKSKEEEVNINEFLLFLDQDLRLGKEYIIESIADLLQTKQMYNSALKGNFFRDEKSSWINSINSVLKQVKIKIIWNKKWN